MNIIPAATSITSLFVTKTDFYAAKATGEVRATVQALSPIPEGVYGNGKGFELTEYQADPSILEEIDFSNGPLVCKFETQIRPTTDRFGRTTNTQVLARLIPDPRALRKQTQGPNSVLAEPVKS